MVCPPIFPRRTVISAALTVRPYNGFSAHLSKPTERMVSACTLGGSGPALPIFCGVANVAFLSDRALEIQSISVERCDFKAAHWCKRRNTRLYQSTGKATETTVPPVRLLGKQSEGTMKTLGITLALSLFTGSAVQAHMTITVEGDQRCIESDGVPDHETGPWREGAVVVEQDHRFCMDATPELTDTITRRARISGITVTGIPLRPGTAEYYDASSERGYSRDPSSGWNVEGIGGLIMDAQNGHVDGDGYYHYHGIPSAVTSGLDDTLFGYAADGFEIHYLGDQVQSSWQLKSGVRESGPGGAHDGTYVQDYEFVAGSGDLDECNGGMLNGQYVYYVTHTYPFFPRCFKGTVSDDFFGGRGDRPAPVEGERPPRSDGNRPPRGDSG
nr:YHYH protein [Roseobacter sp. WL0113]